MPSTGGLYMPLFYPTARQCLALLALAALVSAFSPVMAESDMQIQERVLRAREQLARQQQGEAGDHSEHAGHIGATAPVDKSLVFHGVFYGFLPCDDCNGIKTTLSLKQNDNYLLVTQPARDSSKEYYEKGKYVWDEDQQRVTLNPRKGGTVVRHYHIDNEGTLIQLNTDGTRISGKQADGYILRRSDTVKNREVHIH